MVYQGLARDHREPSTRRICGGNKIAEKLGSSKRSVERVPTGCAILLGISSMAPRDPFNESAVIGLAPGGREGG